LIGVLFSLPFVLVGLYLLIGRFVIDAKERANTYYGVSNERIIIISGLFSRKIKSLNLDTLSDLSLTESRNGSGVITFGPVPPWFAGYGMHGGVWPGMNIVPNFEQVREAREVYEVIRVDQRNAKQGAKGP
jgi:hypothetical protein